MKFSESTISILKNFVTINDSIAFRKGNILRTISSQKHIFAQATLEDEIPQDFAIYDLNNFLSIITLRSKEFGFPELQFDDKHVYILSNNGRSKITYRCCEENAFVAPPDKKVILPTEDVKLTLTSDDISWVLETSSVLHSNHIALVGDGKSYYLHTLCPENDAANTDELYLGNVPEGSLPTCRFLFKTDNWKMIPGDYDMVVSKGALATFIHKTRKLQYWVAMEMGSK